MSQEVLLLLVEHFLELFNKKKPADFVENMLVPSVLRCKYFFSSVNLLSYWQKHKYAFNYLSNELPNLDPTITEQIKDIISTQGFTDLLVIDELLPEQSEARKLVQSTLYQRINSEGAESIPYCFLRNLLQSTDGRLRTVAEKELVSRLQISEDDSITRSLRLTVHFLVLDKVTINSFVKGEILSQVFEEHKKTSMA
ncbi:MAG: hypothetical protein COX77_04890 [Candidatus Komeilibacteria bacterium CG_4_10_14_0_2_um_filter_37_10]|uniref:Uncharacterized protein n=1 Tax=Candidatus Komeilibacteria bacterium CG_4_10_14_0_2_um_filter_37_10 TaxID=1974470 RepID=A0A2M7VD39_9BACT|nr:MAG: hypothetical protein COX77_04890 [Candidatus Komeilibacteria bacterium CG_4_10_14_0_2_um_filter_37_10]PJA92677.1 MAG: hypothetical protein CO133_01900 [Candidatus Komeilibacteria bacterium CG_4_9_14_3_um_filter_37_5]